MGTIFISENAAPQLLDALSAGGHEIYKVKSTDAVYPAISAHPDIYMCAVKDTLLIDDVIRTEPPIRELYEAAMESQIDDMTETPMVPALKSDGAGHIVFDMGNIGHDYPFDVPYNAVSTGRFFIHNTELTSPTLLDRARYAGLHIVNVSQGYTKCSCVTVGDNAVITADEGIARTIEAYNEIIAEELAENVENQSSETNTCSRKSNEISDYKTTAAGLDVASPINDSIMSFSDISDSNSDSEMLDVLLISKGNVALEGFEYGFLGGASGTIGNKVYFNGNLAAHPDFDKIYRFITQRGYEPVWFEDYPLTDIGSIIYLP